MIDVVVPGLETSVQAFPGRIGFWNQGFPPSGPFDSWSFRLANLLVGNPAGAAGLGMPICRPVPEVHAARGDRGDWRRHDADARRHTGAALAEHCRDGGPDAEDWAGEIRHPRLHRHRRRHRYGAVKLGSRSTFHKAGVGGLAGSALKKGSQIPVAYAAGTPGRSVKPECRPEFSSNKQWLIEVVPGPDDDWIDEAGQARFLGSDWKLSAKSGPPGFRLDGPQWTFTAKAYDKLPRRTAPSRPTSSITAIRWVPSTSPARRRSSWSATAPAWAASSTPTRCRRGGLLEARSVAPGRRLPLQGSVGRRCSGPAAHARRAVRREQPGLIVFHEHHDIEVNFQGRADRKTQVPGNIWKVW